MVNLNDYLEQRKAIQNEIRRLLQKRLEKRQQMFAIGGQDTSAVKVISSPNNDKLIKLMISVEEIDNEIELLTDELIELSRECQALFSRLEPLEEQVMCMRYIDMKSCSDVANRMGITERHVKRISSNAKKKLNQA